jgi:anti-sigma B factor antagonist
MPHFDLSATTDGEWAVLTVSGEVDLATGPLVRECLHELAGGGVRHVVVDLRQVSFLDSIGLGVLVAAYKLLRDRDPPGSLRLVCTNQRVVKVFALTGLLRMFPMHASVEQARAADEHDPAGPATTAGASTSASGSAGARAGGRSTQPPGP